MQRNQDVEYKLIEPFVGWIELRQYNNQHFHLTNSAMADTGWNHDAHSRLHRNDLIVQLHLRVGAAFEHVISLGQALVIVQLGVDGNGGDVYGGRKLRNIGESSTSGSARAHNARYLGEIDNAEAASSSGMAHAFYDTLPRALIVTVAGLPGVRPSATHAAP
jgi:hypothetical protein